MALGRENYANKNFPWFNPPFMTVYVISGHEARLRGLVGASQTFIVGGKEYQKAVLVQ